MRGIAWLAAVATAAVLECPARPGATRIQGLNAMPGGLALAGKTRGCSDWCGMHRDDRTINANRDGTPTAVIERAIDESDFIVVDGWRAIRAPHFRFVGNVVQDVEGLKGVPEGKIAIAHNMDPWDLAGKRLFDMAPDLNISMSYSRKASVVMTFAPQHWWQEIAALPVPTLASKTASPALMVWVSSNCRPEMTYHRDTLVAELMKHVRIDARGKCLNNAPRFEGNYGSGHELNYAPYKFALVMENSIEVDWVTEKFFLPFLANTVPVYYGAPNIADYSPGPHSFINMRDFDSPEALARHLAFVSENEDEYAKFFAWRKTQRAPSKTLAEIQAHSMYRDDLGCDVCRCVCDTRCSNSASGILAYPHLPQISPWAQKPTASGGDGAAARGAPAPGAAPRHAPSNAFGRKQGRAFALHDDQFHQDYLSQDFIQMRSGTAQGAGQSGSAGNSQSACAELTKLLKKHKLLHKIPEKCIT